MKIRKGTVVKIHYTLSFADGEMIDSTEGEHPFPYLHGAENIVPGLEAKLDGAQVGDKISVTVQPAEGFGEYDEELIHEIDLDALPEAMDLAVGDELFLVLDEDEEEVPGIIEEIKSESIIVNYNHPLAGETLVFDVEVIEIREADAEELEHGHAHDEHYLMHETEDEDWDELWEAQ